MTQALPGRSGTEKAAIVLLALGSDLGPRILQKFAGSDVRRIMDMASAIGPVDKEALDFLVDDFAAQFAKSLGLSTGLDQVRSLVEQAFPSGALDSMLSPVQATPAGEPVWQRFEPGSENILLPYLLDEHPQTVAVILSRLDGTLAAKCLGMLPGDLRGGVAQRLLKILPLQPACENLLNRRIEQDLLTQSGAGLADEGRHRLAALLNKVERDVADGIVQALAEARPEEARKLRQMIFSFEDIDKLPQASRLALFDKLQTEQVILALRGMPAGFKETALSSLGARARRMVEAELANDTGQSGPPTLAARRTIADLVLAMAAKGELVLPEAAP